ncbi:hypothetical protein [Brevundimonas sp.]|uniref:hypothetical protein n=1 Tax=Brevundimonas sp. TaxID=1871086 RepID=UPI002731BE39|nr:hypothetical protein [Brevundimonas sp.]MDP1911797.1 hypothetical protein [Brevundimonas sp.]
MLRFIVLAIALLIPTVLRAQSGSPDDAVGFVHEIRVLNTTETSSGNGSSGSSRSGGTLIERVIAFRDTGLELEFDLPLGATAEERAREWQWPARVLKAADGTLHLLNAPELEARIDAWLTAGGMTREACGHWIFTWDAFKIECDPQSVITALNAFDLRLGTLGAGVPYTERGGLGPVSLQAGTIEVEGSTFVAETPVDPIFIRRERAETDLVVAEITGDRSLTLEAALEAREAEQVTGTITTTLTTDNRGRVVSRTTIADLTTTDAEGGVERSTSTQRVERRPL